jgi:DNA-3-methyladenine glycosylase I
MVHTDKFTRCPWPGDDPLMVAYHDTEWGVPLRDDRRLFEFLVLDAMQAGLSWRTILHKRENFRKAFADFDPARIARYDSRKIERLLRDPGIIRNRLKVAATVSNARAFLKVQKEYGDFSRFIWELVRTPGRPKVYQTLKAIPAQTPQSVLMSKALKARGFRFVGPTICYAFMQAAGMVNDHLLTCFRHAEIEALAGR